MNGTRDRRGLSTTNSLLTLLSLWQEPWH